jgi:ABC-2 type transport system permease protein
MNTMNSQSNATPGSPHDSQINDAERIAPAPLSPARPLYWSMRREFWENRYLYLAPLAAAAIFLFGYLINVIHSPGRLSALLVSGHTHNHIDISGPFDISAALMMGTAILMNVFYCAEALHGERRDRSILFWKSLPVSDATTVLVKASIPLLILPLLIAAITFVLQLLMLLLSSVVLMATGGEVAALWAHLPILQMSLLTLYHLLTAHALWPAPVYCWLLLVSGWARRATFLWAALPIVAIGGLEKIAFNTTHFAALVGGRFIGNAAAITSTPDVFPANPMTHITPVAFLSAPDLWIGLAVAAIFLAAAVRLRRYQGPI